MNTSKTGLFLMELIISILFFALAGTVCIQLFAKSHMLDGKTAAQNHAIVKCEDFCEIFYGVVDETPEASERLDKIAKLTGASKAEGNVLKVYYDKEFNPCDEGSAVYYLEYKDLGLDDSTGLYQADVKVFSLDQTGDEVYSLSVSKHVPAGLS